MWQVNSAVFKRVGTRHDAARENERAHDAGWQEAFTAHCWIKHSRTGRMAAQQRDPTEQ